jgi:uncharacterized protein YdhG (YjbR/CyaY superfamily)
MRKTNSGDGGLARSNTAPNDMDEYLAGVHEPARTTLSKLRAVSRSAEPAETTEGISYGMPAFKYKGPLIAFAAFKQHCSLFPMNAGLVAEFSDELKNYVTSKGTIRFPLDKPPPAALVKKIVKARVAENEAKRRR